MYILALATLPRNYQPLKTYYDRIHTFDSDSPLCQDMKALIQSRSTEPRYTSPWRGGEWGREEVRHRKWGVQRSERWMAPHYLMWVAGRLSYCRERKSSLWRSWCFCLSVSSASAGLSFSSSSSSARQKAIDTVEKLCRYGNKFSGFSGGAERRQARPKPSRVGWIWIRWSSGFTAESAD